MVELEHTGFLEQEDHSKTLINVAKMRLVLIGVCVVISGLVSDYHGEENANAGKLLEKCLQVVGRDPFQNDMKLFLIRAMAKMFSRDLIKDWGTSGKISGIF